MPGEMDAEMDWAKMYLAGALGYEMYDADRTAKQIPHMADWAAQRKDNLQRAARAMSFEEEMLATYHRITG